MSDKSPQDMEIRKRGQLIAVQRSVIVLATIAVLFVVFVVTLDSLSGISDRGRLIDCTKPGGHCYKESQARLANAVEDIMKQGIERETVTRQIVTLAAYCASKQHNQTLSQIEQCIKQQMKESE